MICLTARVEGSDRQPSSKRTGAPASATSRSGPASSRTAQIGGDPPPAWTEPMRKNGEEQVSRDRAYDAAVDPQRRPGGGGGLRRANEHHHVGDLLNARKTPDQRGRTVLGDEFPFHFLYR